MVELAGAMWLLHQPDSRVHQARRQPDESVADVEKFADEKGIALHGANLNEAANVYEAICEDLRAATGTPEHVHRKNPDDPDTEFPN